MSELPAVEMWTDGACAGNPGPGGWAAILRSGPHEKELAGGEPHTTNNRMELRAVVEGLRALRRPSSVKVVTDSSYVAQAWNAGWLDRWQRNGWRTGEKKDVLNRDLWEELLAVAAPHTVVFERVRGHAGHELNERADRLAVVERDRQRP